MSARDFLINILLHRYNVQQTEVIAGFLFIFITHKICEHLVRAFTGCCYFQTFITIMLRPQKLLNHISKLYEAPNQSVAK